MGCFWLLLTGTLPYYSPSLPNEASLDRVFFLYPGRSLARYHDRGTRRQLLENQCRSWRQWL